VLIVYKCVCVCVCVDDSQTEDNLTAIYLSHYIHRLCLAVGAGVY